MKNLLKNMVQWFIHWFSFYFDKLRKVSPVLSVIDTFTTYSSISENLDFNLLNNMPIPDEAFFGRDNLNNPLSYKDVRAITDDNLLIGLLENRLNGILINQVDLDPAKSPFPLALMACIGIETLGQISVKSIHKKPHTQFVETLKKFDTSFAVQIQEPFLSKMQVMWNNDTKIMQVDSFARLIYTYFRNTMIHGYTGRGIYLSNEDTNSFLVNPDGYLVINPGWLWDKFKQIYRHVFAKIQTDLNSPERIQCLKYIHQLLK